VKWNESIHALVSIIENPNIELGYRNLLRYYVDNNMEYEKDCVDFLIKNKFTNDNNTNTSKK
jgi:hypothetical protein